MFFPEGQIRVHLYGEPVDMRKSFDGLYAMTREGLRQNPLSGDLFVFVSRRATLMKVLYFDRSGFCLWAKRLEAGRFISDWRAVRTREMDWTTLKLLLEGIEPARQRKRFRRTSAQNLGQRKPHSLQWSDAESGFPKPEQEFSEPR
jgi:transposase